MFRQQPGNTRVFVVFISSPFSPPHFSRTKNRRRKTKMAAAVGNDHQIINMSQIYSEESRIFFFLQTDFGRCAFLFWFRRTLQSFPPAAEFTEMFVFVTSFCFHHVPAVYYLNIRVPELCYYLNVCAGKLQVQI